jgi:tRNA(fMet)-specific endonuclease VapC
MPRFMLDTDICSYVIRGTSVELDQRLREQEPGALCMSVVTRAELLYGVRRKPGSARLERLVSAFLERVASLPWDDECAVHYAEIRAGLEKRGQLIGNLDLMIAAHARAVGLVLVSNNERHFGHVPRLTLQNWTRAG